MNPYREALLLAHEMIDGGYPFICNALKDIARDKPRLSVACGSLQKRIARELGKGETLGTWLEDQGIFYTRSQKALCRLAWIDRMLEEYP